MARVGIISAEGGARFKRSGSRTPRGPIAREARDPGTCRVCKRTIEPGDFRYFVQYPEDHSPTYSQDQSHCDCGWWTLDDANAVEALTPFLSMCEGQIPKRVDIDRANKFWLLRSRDGRVQLSEIGKALWLKIRASQVPADSGAVLRSPPTRSVEEMAAAGTSGAGVGGVK